LKFDKRKVPNQDGGTKDSVDSQSTRKPVGLEGGPKDKPAPLGQAADDSASRRSLPCPDKVANQNGGIKEQLNHGLTPAPDKVIQDGGAKMKVFTDENGTTSAPGKIVNEDGGRKQSSHFESAPADQGTLEV
jgi:hypothetical protein